MTGRITSDLLRVWRFVHERTGLALSHTSTALGQLDRDGRELQIGVVYEGYNGSNVWMHVAVAPGVVPLRQFVRHVFAYPFDDLGVRRITGWVSASNMAARRLNEHLGFRLEAMLSEAEEGGDDALVYVMRREDCRVLRVPSVAGLRINQES